MAAYDELRCAKKLEKYIKFVENGSSEAMRGYGGKEVINLTTSNCHYYNLILDRVTLACFNNNWQTRISAVQIYQSLLDIFLTADSRLFLDCVLLLEDICHDRCIDLNSFDSEQVIFHGTPLYSHKDEDLSFSTEDKHNKKINAKLMLDKFFQQHSTTTIINSQEHDSLLDHSNANLQCVEYFVKNYKFMLDHLVSSIWTERHSSALCLEAFIKILYSKVERTTYANYASLLAELGCYCMVVLLLDKYGDYVSCNVVAPVRESVSQLLGVVVYMMNSNDIDKILHIIITTLKLNREFEHGWQTSHSCLVATKYIMLVCKKRQHPPNTQLTELVYQYFIRSFGVDDTTNPNNSGMIMDDVLAEACTILTKTDDQCWSSSTVPITIITFIIDNMELLDESCSSLYKVIDLLIHYVSSLIESAVNEGLSCDFLTKNSHNIIKFLYSYALIPSNEMETLVMHGSTKIVCYTVRNCCLSGVTENLEHLFWGHIYYLIYVLITSVEIDGCLQSFNQCTEECIRCVDSSLFLSCDQFVSLLLSLIASPAKIHISHNEIVKMCPLVGSVFQNTYERSNYVGGLDGPATMAQYNLIAHQRVVCLEAVVKIISAALVKHPSNSKGSNYITSSKTLAKILTDYRLNSNDANFHTQSLVFSAFLYKATTVDDDELFGELFEGVWEKIRYIFECYLPLNGVQDVFFVSNLIDNKHLLSDINQDIAKFLQLLHNSQSSLALSSVNNSKTLRQAISFFTGVNSSIVKHSSISKETIMTILNKLNQIELSKYVHCSRVQLYLILFVVSVVRRSSKISKLEFISGTSSWYIIPLMEGVKYEDICNLFKFTCESLISFIKSSNCTPLEKIFNNITIYIVNSCVNHLPSSANQPQYSLQIHTEHLNNSAITIDTNNGIFAIYYYHRCVNRDKKDGDPDGQDIFPISNQVDCVVKMKEITLKNSIQLATQLLNCFCDSSSRIDNEESVDIGRIVLIDCINKSLFNIIKDWNQSSSRNNNDVNMLINALLLFEHLYVTLDQLFPTKCKHVLEHICSKLLCDSLTTVRTLAAAVMARILSKEQPVFAIHFIHTRVLANVCSEYVDTSSIKIDNVYNKNNDNNEDNSKVSQLYKKYGLAEFVFYIVNLVDENNINLSALSFMVHVVRNLMDENYQVSYCYSLVLSQLMKYIPLFVEECTEFLDHYEPTLTVEQCHQLPIVRNILSDQLHFMRELSMPSSSKPLKLPFEITDVTLRPYQTDGINWLLFLQKYNLNGALCDDMGLGKTLQTIITIAYTHCSERSSETDSACYTPTNNTTTMIICPPILIQHWMEEFLKFLPAKLLTVAKFDDNKQLKTICRQLSNSKIDVLITSYSLVRNHINHLKKYSYNYIVLDEAHLIKNKNSKFYLAIKTLLSRYRLILTGTPIQNNVTELWTLFDFLMPNFLGSYKVFSRIYARPILKGFNPKCTSDAFLLGQKLLGNLHRQILPFVLRRTKHTVLDDLPEKIIQTIFCVMSPLQKALYDLLPFDKETNNNTLNSQLQDLSEAENQNKNTHVFKMIHYLRRVCNHPSLALDSLLDDVALNDKINALIHQQHHSLQDISMASKLVALMELLQECGIYSDDSKSGNDEDLELTAETDPIGHRALIFSQTTTMLDIIENDLLKKHMPNVKYLRLDGTVRQADRYPIAKQFNDDNDISLLLLTTSVGSLGLNLTGADMVIFYDNDWNPMKDLQAMDRAHRIGQTKTVNVYRLVIKDTIEERILNLQNYKLKMVNTVINESNSDLNQMKNSDITDVFGADSSSLALNIGCNDNTIDEDTNAKPLKRSHSKIDYSDHTDFSNGEDYAKQYDLDKLCKNLK